MQILINKTRIQNNFYLLGYESGVLVALELAAILEDHGKIYSQLILLRLRHHQRQKIDTYRTITGLTGTVFCVGCTPDDLQDILEEQLHVFKTEEQLQDSVIRHMSTLLVGEDVAELNDVLRDGGTWSQKLDACVRVLLKHMQHSAQYARGVIEAALASLKRARGYVAPARSLRSQLVLLRATTAHVTSPAQALQRHSLLPVALHQLHTPLSFITKDIQCPSIINRCLSIEMKSEFEVKNLCDAYSLD